MQLLTRRRGESYNAAMADAEDRVILKSLFGIRPGVYLAALYALVILLVLFFALLYPGLRRPGSLVLFESEPFGAAVRIDGVTRGATPCQVFVDRGEREIEMVMPGFSPFKTRRDIQGGLFATAFFPKRERIAAVLDTEDPLESLYLAAAAFAEWSFAGEPTADYQIPQALSEGAYRAGGAAKDPALYEAMNGALEGAARFTVTRAALRDLLRSRFLLDNAGLSPSPLTIPRSFSAIAAYLSENPGAASALARLLPGDAARKITGSSWYKTEEKAAEAGAAEQLPAALSGRTVKIGPLVFREIPSGVLVQDGGFPVSENVDSFFIASSEVSREAYAAFTAARPEWDGVSAASLDVMARSLVSADYLAAIQNQNRDDPRLPVSGVSWHAAAAFTQWLNTLLPPSLAGYEARLPTEAEWDYAAKAVKSAGAENLVQYMEGGLWEWCAEPYAPLPFLKAAGEVIERISSPERPVRGGPWVNAPAVQNKSRPSLPPWLCSAFVSFRPVIAMKREKGL